MRRILTALALSSMLLFAGCATDKRADAMTTTLNAYASSLRWGDFQNATIFLEPSYRAAHPLSKMDIARYKQVRVSEYDEGAGPVPDGENTVQQTVHIDLIDVNNQTVRSIVDHQTWHYDATSKHWWLISGLPDISQH